jgi:tripartite-type tricarboxylate transporter receptor subunit TctC
VQLNRPSASTLRPCRLHARLLGVAVAFLALGGAADAQTDNYPSRPIRLVVPTQAGAAQDILARLLQPYLEKSLGQPIIVENRSGASTMIGTDVVAKAAPDGYTLLIVPTTFTVNAALNPKLSFDLQRDFEPISVLVKNPLLFAVNAKVPARTLMEFVALAKAEPDKINYGTSGASTQAHLLLEMWSARAGIRMQHIPYRGGAPAALAVATGEVQLVLLSSASCRRSRPDWCVRSPPAASPATQSFPICRPPPSRAFRASRRCSGSACWRPAARPRRSWRNSMPR